MVESIPKERWGELDFSEFNETEFPVGEIRGIVENGEIVAWYLIERNQTHVGPFRVIDSRQGWLGGLLIKDAAEQTKNETIYISALTKQAEEMCRKQRMIKIEGSLWIKQPSRHRTP